MVCLEVSIPSKICLICSSVTLLLGEKEYAYGCNLPLLSQNDNTIFNIPSFGRIDESNSSYYL